MSYERDMLSSSRINSDEEVESKTKTLWCANLGEPLHAYATAALLSHHTYLIVRGRII